MDHHVRSPTQDPSSGRVISRDYAEHTSQPVSPAQSHVRSSRFGFGPASIRHRISSTTTSANPSPGPGYSHSGRAHHDSSRRSVAIAAAAASTTARDNDTSSHHFSFAGPPTIDSVIANQTYVDPGYAQLNPAYEQPSNVRPVWGLAKPLPHVLRPGMVPSQDEVERELHKDIQHYGESAVALPEEADEVEDNDEQRIDLESGRIEPVLRPDVITAQLDTIRRERELSLFRSYHSSPSGRLAASVFRSDRKSSDTATEIFDPRSRPRQTIPEVEEEDEETERDDQAENVPYHEQEPPPLELPQLSHEVEGVKEAREDEELKSSYRDAVPLLAYGWEDDEVHNLHTYWSVVRLRFREPLAELLAITVQFTLGFSVNLSMTISRGTAGAADTSNWAWGLATMVAIYIAGGISGAHLNPAMSIMLYIYRGFPLRRVPVYIIAQMLGACFAALIAFGIFQPGLEHLRNKHQEAQSLLLNDVVPLPLLPSASDGRLSELESFITFPRHYWVDTRTAFVTEFVGTAILAISVLALGDDTNAPPGAGMNALVIGLLVTILGMAFGYNTGLAMNPARDFGPRVAMTILGYNGLNDGESLFADGYWFHVAWLAPLTGVVVGGFLYDAAIFVGGESPVNYPAKRIKRAARKWRKRWRARMRKTKRLFLHGKEKKGIFTVVGGGRGGGSGGGGVYEGVED